MVSFAITKVEKEFLFMKYRKLGNTSEEANIKINNFIDSQRELKLKLMRRSKLTEEDINERLKKNFYELCQSLESGERYVDNLKKMYRK